MNEIELKAQVSRLKTLFGNIQGLTKDLKWHYQKLGTQAVNQDTSGVIDSVNNGQVLLEALNRSAETLAEPNMKINIVNIFKDILDSFKAPNAVIHFDFQQENLLMFGKYTEIYRALHEIVQNASDATKLKKDRGTINISAKYKNGMLYVSIGNDGPQIEPRKIPLGQGRFDKSIRHIFDGFSSKGQRGEGLQYVLRTASNHSGHIKVLNKPNNVIFTIIFPCARKRNG